MPFLVSSLVIDSVWSTGMTANLRRSAAPLITTIQKLFSADLARENDSLRQENKILRNRLGRRVPLTEADRRTLVRYGLSIKERLAEVMTMYYVKTHPPDFTCCPVFCLIARHRFRIFKGHGHQPPTFCRSTHRFQVRGCSSPRRQARKFSKDDFFDHTAYL